jgi:hypothetical protein
VVEESGPVDEAGVCVSVITQERTPDCDDPTVPVCVPRVEVARH